METDRELIPLRNPTPDQLALLSARLAEIFPTTPDPIVVPHDAEKPKDSGEFREIPEFDRRFEYGRRTDLVGEVVWFWVATSYAIAPRAAIIAHVHSQQHGGDVDLVVFGSFGSKGIRHVARGHRVGCWTPRRSVA